MGEYWVYSSETVTYRTRVEAESQEEAADRVQNGDVDLGEAQDADGFQIDAVVPAFNTVE